MFEALHYSTEQNLRSPGVLKWAAEGLLWGRCTTHRWTRQPKQWFSNTAEVSTVNPMHPAAQVHDARATGPPTVNQGPHSLSHCCLSAFHPSSSSQVVGSLLIAHSCHETGSVTAIRQPNFGAGDMSGTHAGDMQVHRGLWYTFLLWHKSRCSSLWA